MSNNSTVNEFKRLAPHICFYCGKKIIEDNDLTVDHVRPKSKNGKTLISNLVIACKDCNKNKGSKNFKKYLEECNNTQGMKKMRKTLLKEYDNIVIKYKDKRILKSSKIIINAKRNIIHEIKTINKISKEQAYDYCLLFRKLSKIQEQLEE